MSFIFFFNDTATTEIYTLSLHDALPIFGARHDLDAGAFDVRMQVAGAEIDRVAGLELDELEEKRAHDPDVDRKSTRLNSSHANISYAVFCLKKKHRQANTCK